MTVPGFASKLFDDIGSSRVTQAARHAYKSRGAGRYVFQRTINSIGPSMANGGATMFRNAYALDARGSLWGMNAVRAAGINAGIGAVYGGMTDQQGVGHGMVKGAFIGAGLGVAGRGAVYGLGKIDAQWARTGMSRMQGLYTGAASRLSAYAARPQVMGPGF